MRADCVAAGLCNPDGSNRGYILLLQLSVTVAAAVAVAAFAFAAAVAAAVVAAAGADFALLPRALEGGRPVQLQCHRVC